MCYSFNIKALDRATCDWCDKFDINRSSSRQVMKDKLKSILCIDCGVREKRPNTYMFFSHDHCELCDKEYKKRCNLCSTEFSSKATSSVQKMILHKWDANEEFWFCG